MRDASVPPQTDIDLPELERVGRGKVRELFALGDFLLLVATDRISAFDVVFDSGIPGKGAALTHVSGFWFDYLAPYVPHHLVTANVDAILAYARTVGVDLGARRAALRGRSMLVRRLTMLPVECVARGYLVGSGWREYTEQGAVCGVPLPAGLRLCDRLPEPIFTPATKAEAGHDENITFEQVADVVGAPMAARLRRDTLALYRHAAAYAAERGILLADTKFEFGIDEHGTLTLADEALTPDSSRYWPADDYEPGRSQASFDKQIVRDYLETTGWNKQPPAPPLPDPIVEHTAERYRELMRKLIDSA